jgi:hypothetical protein
MLEFAMLVIVNSETDKLPPEQRQRYLAAWKRFKLLRNTTVAGLILFCLFAVLDFRRPNGRWFALAVLSLVMTSPASIAFQRWKCPRCGKVFSDSGMTRWGWQQPTGLILLAVLNVAVSSPLVFHPQKLRHVTELFISGLD